MKLKFWLLLITFTMPFIAKADFDPGGPIEAYIGGGALIAILVFAICLLISFVFKLIVEIFTKKKRRHIWFQALGIFVLLGLLFYGEYQENLLYNIEMKYSYETRVKVFDYLIFGSIFLGCFLGYLLTPFKKFPSQEKE